MLGQNLSSTPSLKKLWRTKQDTKRGRGVPNFYIHIMIIAEWLNTQWLNGTFYAIETLKNGIIIVIFVILSLYLDIMKKSGLFYFGYTADQFYSMQEDIKERPGAYRQ